MVYLLLLVLTGDHDAANGEMPAKSTPVNSDLQSLGEMSCWAETERKPVDSTRGGCEVLLPC